LNLEAFSGIMGFAQQACFLAGELPAGMQEALPTGWPEEVFDIGHVVNVVNKQYAALKSFKPSSRRP
jgi:hypothetical protein